MIANELSASSPAAGQTGALLCWPPSDHQGAHRVQHPAERVKHQAEDLERDDAEQRFRVAGLAEDDRV